MPAGTLPLSIGQPPPCSISGGCRQQWGRPMPAHNTSYPRPSAPPAPDRFKPWAAPQAPASAAPCRTQRSGARLTTPRQTPACGYLAQRPTWSPPLGPQTQASPRQPWSSRCAVSAAAAGARTPATRPAARRCRWACATGRPETTRPRRWAGAARCRAFNTWGLRKPGGSTPRPRAASAPATAR